MASRDRGRAALYQSAPFKAHRPGSASRLTVERERRSTAIRPQKPAVGMPALYFVRRHEEPVRRAKLSFTELRGMFGAYEARFVSYGWQRIVDDASCAEGCVVAEVTSRDRTTEHYPHTGLYVLMGLSTVKVEEVLKFRDGYRQRSNEAEHWELENRPRFIPNARRR